MDANEIIRQAALAVTGNGAVIATDDTGTILYWNTAAEALYGWTSVEALERNVLDVTPAQMSQDDARNIMQTLLAGNPWTGEFLVRHRNGTPFRVAVVDTPVTLDGRVVGIVGVSHAAPSLSATWAG